MNSSILWIFLIAAWLFILLPMVLRGRPEVKKTTEAVANTRLLHRGGSAAAARRRAGRHPSDPKYVRTPAEPVLKRAEPEEADVPENDADQSGDLKAAHLAQNIPWIVSVGPVHGERPADDTGLVRNSRLVQTSAGPRHSSGVHAR